MRLTVHRLNTVIWTALFSLGIVANPAIGETSAKQAILVDYQTGTVLLEKEADSPMPPASMSKLMTIYMVFEQITNGALSLDDKFIVSEKAWRIGGSRMFLEPNSEVSVEELLRGIIVQSGNDACIVIAEGLASSEEAFAEAMTEKGQAIGLLNSEFRNASGWPEPDHYMTARDLATLASHLITDFPLYYKLFSEKTFTYNGIRQGNRNPLLYKTDGTDGLKTGFTKGSGYGLTASAKRDDRRLIVVVNGLESVNARSREASRLLEWGFRETVNEVLFEAGEPVTKAEVWLGDSLDVPMVLEQELHLTLPRRSHGKLEAVVRYEGPIPAPIKKGTPLGTLHVTVPSSGEIIKRTLVAGTTVNQLSPGGRLAAAVSYLFWGMAVGKSDYDEEVSP